eukprot:TRINITY_DN1478_c0_g1_i11.p1 TRINITY_DN1478_c0_g1~~TRINITY_DN1478_c0_g1_i11.p1  ORF type:complete len:316 (-),score=48.27 TRINITY_DN1478_c0_g1_i11:144-1091(-)
MSKLIGCAHSLFRLVEKSEKSLQTVLKRFLGSCDEKSKEKILSNEEYKGILSNVHLFGIDAVLGKDEIDEYGCESYFINFKKIQLNDILNVMITSVRSEGIKVSIKNEKLSTLYDKYYNLEGEKQDIIHLGFSNKGFVRNEGESKVWPLIETQRDSFIDLHTALDLDTHASLCQNLNREYYREKHLDYHKLRALQNKLWGDESFQKGLALASIKEYPKAIEFYDHCLQLVEDHCEALIAKGCALANLHQYDEGIKSLEQAVKLYPDNEEARIYYTKVLEKANAHRGIKDDSTKVQSRHKMLLDNSMDALFDKSHQ